MVSRAPPPPPPYRYNERLGTYGDLGLCRRRSRPAGNCLARFFATRRRLNVKTTFLPYSRRRTPKYRLKRFGLDLPTWLGGLISEKVFYSPVRLQQGPVRLDFVLCRRAVCPFLGTWKSLLPFSLGSDSILTDMIDN